MVGLCRQRHGRRGPTRGSHSSGACESRARHL